MKKKKSLKVTSSRLFLTKQIITPLTDEGQSVKGGFTPITVPLSAAVCSVAFCTISFRQCHD